MTRLSTGITGLDQILSGGLLPETTCLVRGGPGQGKTTLGLHYLGVAGADDALFIGFQEGDRQLRDNAESIGLDIDHVQFLNLAPDEQFFTHEERYDVFASADVESTPLSRSIVETVNRLAPRRVFIDSLTQLRFISADVYQYRKEVLSFLHFLKARGATVLFSSEHSPTTPDDDLQFLADGVITLDRDGLGQTVRVDKFRGSGYRCGEHQMRNGRRGLEVFPAPVPPAREESPNPFRPVPTGLAALDELLQGGLEQGTITMISGPSGIGKSTLASLIATESAQTEGHTSVYLFEEEVASYRYRAGQLNIEVDGEIAAGRLSVEQVEPMRYLADEFSVQVFNDVRRDNTRLVVFDSTAGFQLTLSDESIKSRLHSLAKSLSRLGVSVLLVNETVSTSQARGLSEKGISYLSDNVIALTYDEADPNGPSRLTVYKKRLSDFDRRPHRMRIGPDRLQLESM